MAKGNFVAYYRVSTERQGASGLGLEAQQQAVRDYLDGGNWDLVAEFAEVESGKRIRRPQLEAAMAACKREGATLVFAKLDRLARNARLLLEIHDKLKGNVVFCDLPQVPPGAVGRFILTNMAAVAELEAGVISERTKAALAAAKARGVQLGKHGKILAHKNREAADDHARRIAPMIRSLQVGHHSIRALAAAMNDENIPTARGGAWHLPSVHRMLKRLERLGL